MSASPKTWKDYVWLAWFAIQIPVITCVDAVDRYPAWLWVPEGSSLHFLHEFRAWYISEYNDSLMQWTPETGGASWVPLFFWVELLFTFPTVLYAVYWLSGLGGGGKGTTGPLELLFLVYAFETAFTTAVCINDVAYWDPAVYSPGQKNVFRFQLFGPWFVMPSLMFLDMYSRLLTRFKAVDTAKKTQ